MTRRAKVIRFPKPPPPEPPAGDLVEVLRCRDQAEALVVRALLDSEGIATALRSNLAHSVHPFSVGDQGETVLLVPASDGPRARAILGRRAAAPGGRRLKARRRPPATGRTSPGSACPWS